MKIRILKYLACSKCGRDLKVKISKKSGGEVESGLLFCERRHRFPIVRSVPRFVSRANFSGDKK